MTFSSDDEQWREYHVSPATSPDQRSPVTPLSVRSSTATGC
ncbi:hypothetical protein NKH18_07075 [Streptomyces sp. M10(2022)]